MKDIFCILSVSLLFVLCSSCRHTNPPSPYIPRPDEAVEPQFALIKMSPELQNHVFVSPIIDSVVVDYVNPIPNLNTLYYGNGLVLCNPTSQDSMLADFAQKQLKILGTSPYVLLDNGYAIVDWKWTRFQPLSGDLRRVLYSSPKIYDNKMAQAAYSTNFNYLNGSLANEEYYLLPINWQDVTDLLSIWSLESATKIDKPEVRYINLKDIEKYGNYAESFRWSCFEGGDFNLIYLKYFHELEYVDANAKKLDSVQAAYVQTLNQMINNNDFEKWTFMYNR